MTVTVFLGSLLAAMLVGMPIAYALLASGVALMWHMDMFDAQILAQNFINGVNVQLALIVMSTLKSPA